MRIEGIIASELRRVHRRMHVFSLQEEQVANLGEFFVLFYLLFKKKIFTSKVTAPQDAHKQ